MFGLRLGIQASAGGSGVENTQLTLFYENSGEGSAPTLCAGGAEAASTYYFDQSTGYTTLAQVAANQVKLYQNNALTIEAVTGNYTDAQGSTFYHYDNIIELSWSTGYECEGG